MTQLRDATKQLVKSRDLGIKKRVVVNFAVVDVMLQALETELDILDQVRILLIRNKSLSCCLNVFSIVNPLL